MPSSPAGCPKRIYHAPVTTSRHRPGSPLRTSLDPIHAVVPLRSVAGGKARLGEAVDAEEREVLILGMLERTLAVLTGWTPCTRVHVVTQDLRVARAIAGPVVSAILQATGGLNEAIDGALAVEACGHERARNDPSVPAREGVAASRPPCPATPRVSGLLEFRCRAAEYFRDSYCPPGTVE